MRSSKRLLAQLELVATRCLGITHVPECGPSSSGSSYTALWTVRSSATHAATAVQQQATMVDLDYARRLREMVVTQPARQTSPPRRRIDLDSIPRFQLPAKQPASNPVRPAVDWQQIVQQARAVGQSVSGEQMLTDKFRWVGVHFVSSRKSIMSVACPKAWSSGVRSTRAAKSHLTGLKFSNCTVLG